MWWLRAAARDHSLDATVSVLYEFAAICDEAHGLGLTHAGLLRLALVEVRPPAVQTGGGGGWRAVGGAGSEKPLWIRLIYLCKVPPPPPQLMAPSPLPSHPRPRPPAAALPPCRRSRHGCAR